MSDTRNKKRFSMKHARKIAATKGWAKEWIDITHSRDTVQIEGAAKVCHNNLYIVWIMRFVSSEFGRGVHLMIARCDGHKEDISWSHMQRIKNELAGENINALEVFPIQSNVVEHNCRHLWCLWPEVALSWGLHVKGSTGRPEEVAQTAKDPKKIWQPKAMSRLLDASGRPVDGGIAPQDFLSPDRI